MKKSRRPNNTETTGGCKIFSIAWPPKMYNKIDRQASKESISKGRFVREIIEDFFNSNNDGNQT